MTCFFSYLTSFWDMVEISIPDPDAENGSQSTFSHHATQGDLHVYGRWFGWLGKNQKWPSRRFVGCFQEISNERTVPERTPTKNLSI